MDGSRLQNTPVVVLLRLLGDLLTVNLLVIICSLPIITTGASFSAMYAVVFTRERQDGSVEVIKTFLRYLKKNFIQGTLLGLILLLIAGAALGDFRFAANMEPPVRSLYFVVGTVITIIGLIVFLLGFAQQSIYHNSIGNYLRNSFFLAFCAPGRLLLALAAWIIPWYLMVALPEVFLVKFGVIYLLWGFSFPVWATARLFNGVFLKTEKKDTDN